MLRPHLAQAEKHVVTGYKNIARQWKLIAKLQREKHDTAKARAILDSFEELQAMHIEGKNSSEAIGRRGWVQIAKSVPPAQPAAGM
jgi:hypothetical protein